MKKIKILLVSLISILAFNINVYAASGSLGVSSSSVYVGDSFTVSVNVNSAAAWNIHVSASGPVDGCTINQADATADALDTNKTFNATCKATGLGTITLNLSGDVTSASDGNAVNVSGSRSVVVSQRPAPSPSPSPSPEQPQKPNNNGNNNNNNQAADNKSKNNNLKSLSVDGYDLKRVNSNNYTLSVPNDVTSINVKATAEDAKSKVTGVGNHNIKVGENNIEVIVTAENGSQNKIIIKVTRKDSYYLEDLEEILKNNKIDDINITIKKDTKITSQDLDKIRNSNKTVKFNYYKDDKSLMYSWIIDGSKINGANDLLTTISNDSDNKKDILRLSNYADGLFIGLSQANNLSSGVKLKVFVGDKYKENDSVNVYSYVLEDEKLGLVKEKVKVENGYIEFDAVKAIDYFVTMSIVSNSDKVITSENNSSSNFLLIIVVVLSLLVVGLVIALIVKNKKDDNSNANDNNEKVNQQNTDHKNNDSSIKSENNNQDNISIDKVEIKDVCQDNISNNKKSDDEEHNNIKESYNRYNNKKNEDGEHNNIKELDNRYNNKNYYKGNYISSLNSKKYGNSNSNNKKSTNDN